MLIDTHFEFCDETAVNAAAGAALVGSAEDFDVEVTDPASGRNVYLVIQVTAAFTSAGAATVSFEFRSDATASVHPTTGTLHLKTAVFPYTDLIRGKRIIMQLPQGIPAYERYCGIIVVTAGATTTAGSINAFLTLEPENWKSYPAEAL